MKRSILVGYHLESKEVGTIVFGRGLFKVLGPVTFKIIEELEEKISKKHSGNNVVILSVSYLDNEK